MKTWRERIAEARERGAFTAEDYSLIHSAQTCVLHEIGARFFGSHYCETALRVDPSSLPERTRESRFMDAMSLNDFGACERLLDELEDRALALKRAQGG